MLSVPAMASAAEWLFGECNSYVSEWKWSGQVDIFGAWTWAGEVE
jgi:hypothetical protein